MTRRVVAVLERAALRQNLRVVRDKAAAQRVVAVVKADAYGHGAGWVAESLSGKVDAFAVATVDEGVHLRSLGLREPVWILSDYHPSDIERVTTHRLLPVAHEPRQLQSLVEKRIGDVFLLKLDTGMGRLGFEPARLGELLAQVRDAGYREIRLLSHLGCADEPDNASTAGQIRVFEDAGRGLGCDLSLANSAAILAWPAAHLEWVRPGIMLYGASPIHDTVATDFGLSPVMTLRSRVLAIRQFEAGQAVGYGGTWVCRRATRAAVLACGYGDGYPRHAPSGTPVLFRQGTAPLIGRVSMDSMMTDVTGLPGVQVGDEVTLWGRGLPAETVAGYCGTIAYELFCRLTDRIEREVR